MHLADIQWIIIELTFPNIGNGSRDVIWQGDICVGRNGRTINIHDDILVRIPCYRIVVPRIGEHLVRCTRIQCCTTINLIQCKGRVLIPRLNLIDTRAISNIKELTKLCASSWVRPNCIAKTRREVAQTRGRQVNIIRRPVEGCVGCAITRSEAAITAILCRQNVRTGPQRCRRERRDAVRASRGLRYRLW